jgi:hypothetical protein
MTYLGVLTATQKIGTAEFRISNIECRAEEIVPHFKIRHSLFNIQRLIFDCAQVPLGVDSPLLMSSTPLKRHADKKTEDGRYGNGEQTV